VDVLGTMGLFAVFVLTVALRHRLGPAPAPRLAPDLAQVILLHAGFPTTPHNVLAVQEHLGALFLEQGRGDVDPARWDQVVAACEAARAEAGNWAQHVLDQVAAAWNGADGVAGGAAATRLVRRCQDVLLAGVGTGHGPLGGSLFEPLPRVTSAAV
jgi:hypothetical protein